MTLFAHVGHSWAFACSSLSRDSLGRLLFQPRRKVRNERITPRVPISRGHGSCQLSLIETPKCSALGRQLRRKRPTEPAKITRAVYGARVLIVSRAARFRACETRISGNPSPPVCTRQKSGNARGVASEARPINVILTLYDNADLH